MITLPGYQLTETLYQGARSLVYRGYREADRLPVVCKLLRREFPDPQELAYFRREYEIISGMNLPGVLRAYALEPYRNSLAMILEDFGGVALGRQLGTGAMEIGDFLPLAIAIVESLGQIHQLRIIHKDINPANILLNPATRQIKLIDFGISTQLSREEPDSRPPTLLEGTPAYMSPEQTGRMNRSLDYRTDFYSLGATFYELLTGRPPFLIGDALELVHAHIARQPMPPHLVNPELPEALSALIMKLLAKTAEERYQSSYGLRSDLHICLSQWRGNARINLFSPGQNDRSERFQIPQKLYGRTADVACMLEAFERASVGAAELLLVSGQPGIGKSALINEIHKPIVRERGYMIAGKFDQLQQGIPYSALIDALRDLIRQILTESKAAVADWRERLIQALGPNAQVIIDVLPDVELIIGPQAPMLPLGPSETQNRFRLVFRNFLHVFTHATHPLVIFLDDLQWADQASLAMLQLLLGDGDTRHLLLVGAYRDSQIVEGTPLAQTLRAIEQADTPITRIALTPLGLIEVQQLIVDALHSDAAQALLLAELVVQKTAGNPFFVGQFLTSLAQAELIWFDGVGDERQWRWDLAQIRATAITANVVDLLVAKIERLPAASCDALQVAACIGGEFALETLALVRDQSPAATVADLWPATDEELLVPIGSASLALHRYQPLTAAVDSVSYRFMHDRVQQAAYSLVSAERRQEIHLSLGRLLLRRSPNPDEPEELFAIVSHLNLGRSLISSSAERLQLARLNLQAGRRAKRASAYLTALDTLTLGIELATAAGATWASHYDLVLALYQETAEAAYLCSETALMERLCATVIQQARSTLDKVATYEIQIQSYIAQHRMPAAITTALMVLDLLGVSLPAQARVVDIMRGYLRTRLLLGRRPPEALAELPPMSDPLMLAAMRVMMTATAPAYFVAPNLFPLIVFQMTQLSVRYGNAPFSAYSYCTYGVLLCAAFGDIPTGYRFGQLGLHLMERFDARELHAKMSMVFYNSVKIWKDHLAESLPALEQGYRSGLETGDLEYAALNATTYGQFSLYTGRDLEQVEREIGAYAEVQRKLNQARDLHMSQLFHQAVQNLRGQSDDPRRLDGPIYREVERVPALRAANDRSTLALVLILRMLLCYTFGDSAQAAALARIVRPQLDALLGTFHGVIYHFYGALALLGQADGQRGGARRQSLREAGTSMKKLQSWAKHAPANSEAKLLLVRAEHARVLGQPGAAREYYDQAIAAARHAGYTNDEALACELALRFYLSNKQQRLAQLYFQEARYAYTRWGATAKLHDLDVRYGQLVPEESEPRPQEGTTLLLGTSTTTTSGTYGGVLDLEAIMRASQAISSEIELDRLLDRLMTLVIENAGAQRGALLLSRDGELSIEVQGQANSVGVTISRAAAPAQPDAQAASLPLTIINYVARTLESVVLNNATSAERFVHDRYISERRPRAILCTPLVNQGKLLSIVYLENNLVSGAFTPQRLEIVRLLSAQAAISIENARLYSAVRESERRLSAFLDAMPVGILVVDAKTRHNHYVNDRARELLGIRPDAAAHSLPRLYQAGSDQPYPSEREPLAAALRGARSAADDIVVQRGADLTPLEISGTPIYDDHGQIAYAIATLQDITERRRAERERLHLSTIERELSIAQEIQRSLLPPAHPHWHGLDMLCHSSPAREVAGDLYAYHAFTPADGPPRFGAAIGDVTGKGVPAALLMAISLASFQSIVAREPSPAELLADMDRTLTPYTRYARQNCGMVYVDLTLPGPDRPGELRAANAGGVAPLIRRADGSLTWVDVGGMPAGVGLGALSGYRQVSLPLAPADVIILTSDGVVEATNAAGEMFGFTRLEETISAGPSGAEAMLVHLQHRLADFVGATEPHDDLTLVIIQVGDA